MTETNQKPSLGKSKANAKPLDKDKQKRRRAISREDWGEGVWPGAQPGQGGEVWAETGLPVETEPGGSVCSDR